MKKWLPAVLLAAALSQSAMAEMVFNRGNGEEPESLDPQIANGVSSGNIIHDMFTGLTENAPDGKVIPGVAESWDISDDGLTYTFHLRHSNWSNDEPVTAKDFVYAWQRAVDPKTASEYAFFLYPVENGQAIAQGKMPPDKLGITALDDYTLKVQLSHPTPYFLSILSQPTTAPNPIAIVEKFGNQWTHAGNMVSNGPFKMTEWQPNDKVVLVKNPDFYDAKDVKLDKVVYYPTEDESTELKRYRAGELDYTYTIPSTQIKMVKKNFPKETKIAPYLGTFYFAFNLTKPPFKDNPKLRKALNLVINRKAIAENVLGGGQQPAYGFVPPGTLNSAPYTPAYATVPYAQRVTEAKKLYAEAGYSKSKPLTVELLYNTKKENKIIAIAVSAMWKQALGVKTEMKNEDWKSYLADRKARNTQIYRASWIGDYNDPNTFLDMWQTTSSNNAPGYSNADYDKLITEAGHTMDLEKRAALFQQAEKHLIDDDVLIPIYFYVSKHLVKPYVTGYTANTKDYMLSRYVTVAPH